MMVAARRLLDRGSSFLFKGTVCAVRLGRRCRGGFEGRKLVTDAMACNQLLLESTKATRQVEWETARDQVAVHHAGLIRDGGPGILKVYLDGPETRHLAPPKQPGTDQHQRTVADGKHRLAGLKCFRDKCA